MSYKFKTFWTRHCSTYLQSQLVGRLWEDDLKFKASLGNFAKPRLKMKNNPLQRPCLVFTRSWVRPPGPQTTQNKKAHIWRRVQILHRTEKRPMSQKQDPQEVKAQRGCLVTRPTEPKKWQANVGPGRDGALRKLLKV